MHSHYQRRLADLPAAGVRIALILRVRRFFCDAEACARRIFAERFEAVEPKARRTSRLDDVVHCLAIALGGRPAASLSRRLNVDVSNDTLLRMVRRRRPLAFPPPAIVGIDDWAWRRNHRYGTLICDLERRATIALLPEREPATAEAWLAASVADLRRRPGSWRRLCGRGPATKQDGLYPFEYNQLLELWLNVLRQDLFPGLARRNAKYRPSKVERNTSSAVLPRCH